MNKYLLFPGDMAERCLLSANSAAPDQTAP